MNETIEELRQRWENDPSPQLSMQLAEEYRRLDQRREAAEVLTKAMEENPEHVAARVALGRFKSELGEVDEACGLLEKVVTEDPTHLVASKLLVGLYLERGDDRQARDRLDLYKLLNESDPEIEVLEARLAGSPTRAATVTGVVDIPRNGDPFQGLWSDMDSTAYWQALGAEGIFPVAGQRPAIRRLPVPPVVEEPEEDPGATVTLATLYLQQGHLDDAEKSFGEVLSREPGNPDALAGMEEINRQRVVSLATVEDAAPVVADRADTVAARKIEVLKDYLHRLRAAGNDR